ncbi:class I SAM-dependent methyltransferase [Nocardioides sp. zg-1230]|uniref:class I SAM-dependent methyltransferase n=1 Tax=Nocardioides sp. zg-1230 TaxID=2736601 RepID=UPI00155351CC|nr:class I SAM-dependent methyltransferase [Nocardioides sp. zg-1230]NPC44294.1 class I SAM-dependent methyltransferase [Nocardioides sp. zg-1230]
MTAQAFADAWEHARTIDGWLTEDQARVLHAEASAAEGTVVEIGSHLGRSTVVLASAGTHVVAIDPFPDSWRYGRSDTADRFRTNLARAGVTDSVTLLQISSHEALAGWGGRVALLYVDGKHDVVSCLRDLRWTRWLPSGARFLVHDAFSSVGVTLAMLVIAFTARHSRYIGRTGSLALFENEAPGLGDRARLLAQLPWFVRNLTIKVLLRSRLTLVARLLGHDDTADPY